MDFFRGCGEGNIQLSQVPKSYRWLAAWTGFEEEVSGLKLSFPDPVLPWLLWWLGDCLQAPGQKEEVSWNVWGLLSQSSGSYARLPLSCSGNSRFSEATGPYLAAVWSFLKAHLLCSLSVGTSRTRGAGWIHSTSAVELGPGIIPPGW